MGLAASQAKLLSITARLSDNELRSQTLTAAKMSLANQTTAASRKYIDALDSTNLIYSTYDLDGNKTYVDLTGYQLSQYAPLKNQYGLVNTNGQILVSETDAANYEASSNINEFLEKYGVNAIDTGEVQTIENPEYQDAYDKWAEEYEEWLKGKPDASNDIYWTVTEGTDSELYNIFKEASASCFRNATGGDSGCYRHVLAHMLDVDPDVSIGDNGEYGASGKKFDTTLGGSITINSSMIWGSAIHGDTVNGMNASEAMVPVSDAVRDGWNGQTVMAAEHTYPGNDEQWLCEQGNPPKRTLQDESKKLISDYYLQEALANGTVASEAEQLISNYKYTYDNEGNIVGTELKTLREKCIDLYYILAHSNMGFNYNTTMLDVLYTFQDDMSVAFTERIFDETKYNTDYGEWLADKPDPLTVPPTIDKKIYEYDDKDKAQWYVNLWHRMNGPSDEKDGTITDTTITTTVDENGEYVINKTETTSLRYDVLEDGLMNSAEWLQYALESGSVTLERVNYENPTETGTGLEDGAWTSIIYTNATDISSEADDAAVAKAEAEYEATTKDIEAKDKQYDSMLKLLDTEHSALQTEYDSVKSVISKNTERTLKMYSA